MSRYARRKDENHRPIVDTFEAMGCSWLTIESSVSGVPDGNLGCAGRTHLVEIKPNETLTRDKRQLAPRASQVAWAAKWQGGPVHVVRSTKEAMELVNLLRMVRR